MTDTEKYVIARWAYSIGKDFITDAEYNLLHQKMLLSPAYKSLAQKSWSDDVCPVELLKKYNLEDWINCVIPTGDKSSSIESINSVSVADKVLKNYSEIFLSTKDDGFNVQTHYIDGRRIIANSRGRATDAVSYSNLTTYLPSHIPIKGYTRIYGELVLPDDGFEYIKSVTESKTQRASVSTALSRKEYAKYLEYHVFWIENKNLKFDTMVDVYETAKSWGFKTPIYKVLTNSNNYLYEIENFSKLKGCVCYPTDGCVIQSNHLPSEDKYALRIFDWKEPYYKSFILGYQYSHAIHNFGIKLVIYPITTDDGKKQSLLDIDNLARILDNKLNVGTPVVFKMTSHAVANIDLTLTRELRESITSNEEYCENIKRDEEYMRRKVYD